jgi:hypothetical protein
MRRAANGISRLRAKAVPESEYADISLRPVTKGPPLKQTTPASTLKQTKTQLVEFASAPFPFSGRISRSNQQFMNVAYGGRRGHRTWGGHVYWEDETYSDSHVLIHVPKGFDIRRPAVIVLFFHGHGATLERDVRDRQKLPAQITASGVNAVLISPQLAFDARDSSIGKLGEPGGFDRFMEEAQSQLVAMYGDERARQAFARMPIMIVAYSGGYVAASSCLANGGIGNRVRGVVLMDALYGDVGTFAHWIEQRKSGFFISAYAGSTRSHNQELESILKSKEISYNTNLPMPLRSGNITFISTAPGTEHRDFVTNAWVQDPVKDILQRLRADIR